MLQVFVSPLRNVAVPSYRQGQSLGLTRAVFVATNVPQEGGVPSESYGGKEAEMAFGPIPVSAVPDGLLGYTSRQTGTILSVSETDSKGVTTGLLAAEKV